MTADKVDLPAELDVEIPEGAVLVPVFTVIGDRRLVDIEDMVILDILEQIPQMMECDPEECPET